MIKSANVPYVICFPQGASGRFAKYLLYSMLTDSDHPLYPCPMTNSTHATDDRIYTGYSATFGDNSSPDIWEKFEFDKETNGAPRIFATHQFPDFKLIRQRLGANTRIIIITVDPTDLAEVIINDRVKNTYDLLSARSPDPLASTLKLLEMRYQRFLNKPYPGTFVLDDIIQIGKCLALDALPYFTKKAAGLPLHPDRIYDYEERLEKFVLLPKNFPYPRDRILTLSYSELYKDNTWSNKIGKFTNTRANTVTDNSYQRYINGRNILTEKYRM